MGNKKRLANTYQFDLANGMERKPISDSMRQKAIRHGGLIN